MNVGYSVRKIRKEKFPQLSQNEFAGLVGITQTYLSQIETGAKVPTIVILEKISKYLSVPLPIIFWFSIQEEDVSDHKRDNFSFLKPTVDSMINTFF